MTTGKSMPRVWEALVGEPYSPCNFQINCPVCGKTTVVPDNSIEIRPTDKQQYYNGTNILVRIFEKRCTKTQTLYGRKFTA
jgi:hypothetical protein